MANAILIDYCFFSKAQSIHPFRAKIFWSNCQYKVNPYFNELSSHLLNVSIYCNFDGNRERRAKLFFSSLRWKEWYKCDFKWRTQATRDRSIITVIMLIFVSSLFTFESLSVVMPLCLIWSLSISKMIPLRIIKKMACVYAFFAARTKKRTNGSAHWVSINTHNHFEKITMLLFLHANLARFLRSASHTSEKPRKYGYQFHQNE